MGSSRIAAALVAIGLTGAALRLIGLSWGLPFAMHPDEPLILDIAERMSWSNLDPDFFHYPSFFIYQVFLLRLAVDAAGGDYADLLYAARFLSAAYGLATVAIVYLLGARLGGRWLGVIAATLVALMGALTLQAHYAVTDTAATALVTAVIWWSVRGWQRRSGRELVGATLLAGLAVSTKYSVVPICFVPWAAAMTLMTRSSAPLGRRAAATVGLAATAIAAFLAASPYAALDHQAFVRDLREEVALQAQAQAGEHSDPLLDVGLAERGLVGNLFGMYDDMGAAAFVMAVGTLGVLAAGMLLMVTGRRNPFAHIAADPFASFLVVLWVLLYLAVMAPSAKYGERYLLPLYPALMLLAAIPIEGARTAGDRLVRRPAAVLAGVALLAASGPSAVAAIDSTRLLALRDSRLVARDWAIDNLPTGSRLAREFYAPPFRDSDGFRLLQPFSLTELSFAAYCADGVDYLLLSSLNENRYRADPGRFADRLGWYDQLDTHTRLLRRVEGAGDLLRHHPTIEIRHLFCRDGAAPGP